MNKKDLNKILKDGFEESLGSLGFKKAKLGFLKPIDNKWSIEFGFSVIDYGSIYPSTFSYALVSYQFDKLYSKILEINKQGLWVYSTGIGSLFEKGKYPIPKHAIKTKEDAYKMVEEVTVFLKNDALSYLESIANFKTLDTYYNQSPTRPDFGIRSLIIAKMAQNPNYNDLKVIYRQLFIDKNWAVKEDIKNLEKAIAFLDKRNKEELEALSNT